MSTKHHALSKSNGWVLIGKGPALIEALKEIHVHCGDEQPPAATKVFHNVGRGSTSYLQVDKTLKIWARANTMFGSEVVITGEDA